MLMEAAKRPRPDILRLLIRRGANVHYRLRNNTALAYAIYSGQEENVKVLLAAGASPDRWLAEEAKGASLRELLVNAVTPPSTVPPARTFRDLADVPAVEPSADDKD